MRRELQESVAADGLLDHSVIVRIAIRGQRRWAETRLRVETRVQFEVAIRGIETGMVEDVERIGLEFQGDTLSDLEILEYREIETHLGGRAEEVAAVVTETGFYVVAKVWGGVGDSRAARGHSILAWAQQGNGEIIGVHVWNPDSGIGSARVGLNSSACGRLLRRDSRLQRKNWIGDEVIGTVVNAGRGSRKIDNAERLTRFRHRDALETPAVYRRIDQSRCVLQRGQHVHITYRKHVGAVEIGG